MARVRDFAGKLDINISRTVRRIQVAADEMGLAMGAGLRIAGELIMTDVVASRPGAGVPRKTGALANSKRVEGPTGDREPKVTLSFGGASAPYALRQHETLEYHHDVGEARYLVRGVERFQKNGLRQARQALKENMRAAANRARRVS